MSRNTLWLDFSPGARAPLHKGVACLVVSALLLAAATAALATQWLERGRQLAALDAIDAQRSAPSATKRRSPPSAAEAARARALRQVADQLTTPWSDLLDALEAAPADVALIAIEPSVNKHSVRLTVEARGASEMLTYLAAVQSDRRLSQVVLVSHQIQVQTPGAPVRFQLQAVWGAQP
jgi:hypothetical protein